MSGWRENIAIAVLVAITGGLCFVIGGINREHADRQYAGEPRGHQQLAPGRGDLSNRRPAGDRSICKHANTEKEYELCHAWRSAEAADKAADAAWAQFVVSFVALLGLAGTVYYAMKAANGALRAAEASEASAKTADATLVEMQALTLLSHPPKLRVRHVMIVDANGEGPRAFSPGDKFTGSAQISNIGTTAANIEGLACMWYWRQGPLPMQRPYDDQPIVKDDMRGESDPIELEYGTLGKFVPGAHGRWKFTVTVPASYKPGMRLYVMGRVLGIGERETRYTTLFARRYDLRKRRFVSVENNDDYAHYE